MFQFGDSRVKGAIDWSKGENYIKSKSDSIELKLLT